jgi:hypothetical protein
LSRADAVRPLPIHPTANGRIGTGSVVAAGCWPSRIASTMSGTNSVGAGNFARTLDRLEKTMREHGSGQVQRREFLVASGHTIAVALAAATGGSNVLFANEQTPSLDTRGQRVASVIHDYDGQGNHRTGTQVDNASAEWLASQVRQLGVKPAFEPFSLDRIDPQSCYLRIAGRRIEGVPVFDAGFTGAEGVHGRLGPLGSDAEIGLVETEPYKLSEPGS